MDSDEDVGMSDPVAMAQDTGQLAAVQSAPATTGSNLAGPAPGQSPGEQEVGTAVPEDVQELLNDEAERRRARCVKFGSEFVPPTIAQVVTPERLAELQQLGIVSTAGSKQRLKRDSRQQAVAEAIPGVGFVTGFDITTEEQQALRAKRADRFGVQVADDATMEATPLVPPPPAAPLEAFEQRRNASHDEGLRTDAIHVFGTDDMSTKDLMTCFADYGPSTVEWINDSSCNVLFIDEFSAKRVWYASVVLEGGEDMLDQPLSWRGVVWHRPGRARVYKLQVRFATNADKRDPTSKYRSQWWRKHPRGGSRAGRHAALSSRRVVTVQQMPDRVDQTDRASSRRRSRRGKVATKQRRSDMLTSALSSDRVAEMLGGQESEELRLNRAKRFGTVASETADAAVADAASTDVVPAEPLATAAAAAAGAE